MFKLTIVDDEGRNTVVPLPTGRDEFTIGRKDGNTIKLTEQNVSRQHARLVRANGSFYIEDKGSYTGVRVNGDRITGRRHIKEGDEIRIGDYHLSLSIEKVIEKEKKNEKVTSGTAVIVLDKKQQERLRAGEKPSIDRGRLCLLSGPLAGKIYGIERDEVVIGRTDDNDIVLNHRSISRNHAKIVVSNNVHQIVDLGSANGVRVNGEEYGKIDLRKGDKIDLGHVRLRFIGPNEDFTYDATMKEDVVGDDDSGKGGAGLWVALALGLVLVAGVGAYAAGLFGEKTTTPIPSTNKTLASGPSNPKTTEPVNTPPSDDKAALLKQANEAAEKGDYSNAGALAAKAGDEALSKKYYDEGNAKEFLPLCEDAVKSNKADDILTYCYNALKDFTETETYKKAQPTIDDAKTKYKQAVASEAKSLLDKAEGVVKTNTKDIKQLGQAKSLVSTANNKLDNASKFVGSDGDLSSLNSRAAALSATLKDIKAECDEAACSAKGGQCNASGACVPKPVECPAECAKGCKPKTNVCKPDDTSVSNPPKGCDPSSCKGTCEGDVCKPAAASGISADEIKSKLAAPDGCQNVSAEEFNILKSSSKADYYFFKAYCARDANPGKACGYYKDFLKIAPGDGRKGQATSFIKSQDPTAYEECVLE